MMRALLIIAVVVGALIGGLLVLRNSAATGVPDKDVLARARKRAQELEARDSADKDRDP
jgi:hypothetical protein